MIAPLKKYVTLTRLLLALIKMLFSPYLPTITNLVYDCGKAVYLIDIILNLVSRNADV
jgi:hypothetical protein